MAGLVKHAITDKVLKQMLFKAGVYYKNLTWKTSAWDGEVLGATSGGGKISIEQTFIDAELDGAGVKIKGGKVKTGETASMEINFVEISPDVIASGLHMEKASDAGVEGYDKYTTRGTVQEGDYLDNVAFVGELNSGKQAIVIFENAFCTGALELEAKYGEQASYANTYESHASINQKTLDHLPITMYFPTELGMAMASEREIMEEMQEV